MPPNFPPRKVNGISVGCFLTPDTAKDDYTHPTEIKAQITELVGEYPTDVKGFRTGNKDWLSDEIFEMSKRQWKVVKWMLKEKQWDYFQFVDIGLDRVHHGFWNYLDPSHVQYKAGNPYEEVIRDYYLCLDDQIGSARIAGSRHCRPGRLRSRRAAARRRLLRQRMAGAGRLARTRQEYPKEVTPFNKLNVNWAKTKVWSEGGYYARVFFNVQGREPNGVIPQSEYESFQNEIKAKLEALPDDKGEPMNSLVFKPKEIYKFVRNVAPDLIVHFGGLYWRSIGSVGHGHCTFRKTTRARTLAIMRSLECSSFLRRI